ncbi:UNVERIFIED_CONTAM: hypothetical protein FKN15_041896 [Acipenser sinensis]
MYECQKSEQYDMADVPTYEEVTPYRRQSSDKYRLVVLVGPVGVGLNELKRKLLVSDPQHYSVTVPREYHREFPITGTCFLVILLK